MDALLKWAILNGATANEDAPNKDTSEASQKKLDPAIIDAILGKPASVQMTECMDAVEHPETPLESREVALDDLEMLVENIDNASNLEPLGLWPRLLKLYADREPSIRTGALWVSGTAVQHNPNAQKAFESHSGAAEALKVLMEDSDMGTRTKALYCISSFVRANVQGLTKFISSDGLVVLLQAIGNGSNALRQKVFFLLRALIDEALDDQTPQELRPGMYLPNAIAELGFVDATAAAVDQMASDETAVAAFEQAVEFLAALKSTESGSIAVKNSAGLHDALVKARTAFSDAGIEGLDQLF
ncbi:hsp70 nucleotide exchange factor fes1 [Dipsacomyces acuminosporus]|nr:hsp70 nucleotide exchange factor fes1 [Dipsacomyces acuminosporus]